jgi:hypothetical protein
MEIVNVSFGGGMSMQLTPVVVGLACPTTTIVEGNTLVITFTTNTPGAYPYTITGVSSSDIGNASLTGTFTANGETRTYTVSDDLITEGRETFLMTLDNGQAGAAIGIDDPYYTLTANVASLNEGNVFTVTFVTNAVHALPLPYTISGTGITSNDISGTSLTGNLTSNGQVLTFTANADITTEGAEYFLISLNNGRANANVLINDTSTPYYTLTANRASVNEGNSFTVTFSTNAIGQLPLGYTITGVSNIDFNGSPSLTGNFTSNNQVLTYTANVDITTEGTEYFLISLNNGQANANVTINDTSLTIPGQQEYTVAGTYSWVAPTGVIRVSVVAVGAGGGGGDYSSTGGGGGGALSWGNATVTPGQTYTVIVGTGGIGGGTPNYFTPGTSGGYSAFGSNVIYAKGGTSAIGYTSYGGNVIIGDGGGYGGDSTGTYHTPSSGAGAGGYTGKGGDGTGVGGTGSNGAGGGGGGGGGSRYVTAGGGGVGIYGAGSSGLGGLGGYYDNGYGGQGGSGGQNAANAMFDVSTTSGGRFGGGGGTGRPLSGYASANGAGGAVRIVWGSNRYYPSTNTANV